jgi:hypothetical protein
VTSGGTATRDRPLSRLLVESVLEQRGPLPDGLADVDLDEALEAAQNHRIAPAVFRRIRSESVADGWGDAFRRARDLQLLRHMHVNAELRSLAAILDGSGIRWVAAKGPVAADTIWPSADMREYFDLDLFVSPAQFEQALDALLAAGCRLIDRNWSELARTMRAEVALQGPLGTLIDLHWHIAVPPALRRAFPLDIDGMLSRARRVTLGGGLEVPAFDPIDTVVHLAFHAAQAGGTRLMWCGDIHYALQDPGFESTEFWARVHRGRAARPVSLVLGTAASALGQPTDSPVYRHLDAGGIWGAVIRRAVAARPVPSLPSDRHTGGNLVSGVRATAPASAVATLRSAIEIRAIERRVRRTGPQERTLYVDVPDVDARQRYFHGVRASAGTS